MAHRGERHMKCPDCAKRGVYLGMPPTGDVYRCRYCAWGVSPDGFDRSDRDHMDRLRAANPDEFAQVSGRTKAP